jgi:protoporphyrin/coproporphyrin ferrochelatase
MSMTEKVGVLLINLGTPDNASVPAVRTYLDQFLNDPRVLDIPPLVRWFLLTFVILRSRPAQSAHAYQKVWGERGSPLLYHTQDLQKLLEARIGDRQFALGMRYGSPSIESAVRELMDARLDRIVVVPLYPQEASSSTSTALEEVYRVASAQWKVPTIQVVPPFFADEAFIEAWATVYKESTDAFKPDHILFSYHGLPERHILKGDPAHTGDYTQGRGHCLKDGCCDTFGDANRHCYRAQCYASTRAMIKAFGIEEGGYSVSFQSRLGKDPWVQPFTDEVIPRLAAAGHKRLAVLCPAFVADCLETIEEIGMTARDQFLEHGGEAFQLVPCLNAHPAWADALAKIIGRL